MVQSALLLFWARLGSLNALETLGPAPFFDKWLGRKVPSADTIGRVYDALESDALRAAIQQVYERLKRNKALGGIRGLGLAVIDGHESHASDHLQIAAPKRKSRGSAGTSTLRWLRTTR